MILINCDTGSTMGDVVKIITIGALKLGKEDRVKGAGRGNGVDTESIDLCIEKHQSLNSRISV